MESWRLPGLGRHQKQFSSTLTLMEFLKSEFELFVGVGKVIGLVVVLSKTFTNSPKRPNLHKMTRDILNLHGLRSTSLTERLFIILQKSDEILVPPAGKSRQFDWSNVGKRKHSPSKDLSLHHIVIGMNQIPFLINFSTSFFIFQFS